MTAPGIAQDEINGTATSTATMLTEYMPDGPAVVINLGTDRVRLGTGSQVSPTSGIPLEPGAFVTWSTPGQLWMVLDSAATSTSAAVMATSRLTSWEASPAAIGDQVAAYMVASGLAAQIGLQVAEQANTLGIPGTFHGSKLWSGTVTPGATSFEVPVDLSGAAGITLNLNTVPTGQRVTFAWCDGPGGSVFSSRNYQLTGGVLGAGQTLAINLTLPVESGTLRILLPAGAAAGLGGATTQLSIYGSNRLHAEAIGNLDAGAAFIKTQAFTANTEVFLGALTTPGGLHWGRVLTSGTGTGYFGYILATATGATGRVYFARNVTANSENYQLLAIPPGVVGLVFLPSVTGTYTVELDLTPGNFQGG